MLLGPRPEKRSGSLKLSVPVAGHQEGIQSFSLSCMLSVERAGRIGEELLKAATGTGAVHNILPSPGARAPHLTP